MNSRIHKAYFKALLQSEITKNGLEEVRTLPAPK